MEFDFFAGLDEAGRGPLAGPVSAGCVSLSPDFPVELFRDFHGQGTFPRCRGTHDQDGFLPGTRRLFHLPRNHGFKEKGGGELVFSYPFRSRRVPVPVGKAWTG